MLPTSGALAPDALRWRCDPADLGFESTEDVPPCEEMLGQSRALDAIQFGVSLDSHRYNLYVAGPSGSGRTTAVRRQLEQAARARSVPSDWCYLHNFADPYRPLAYQVPPGHGPELARDLDRFIADCRRDIPKVLDSEDFHRRRAALAQRLDNRREAVLGELRTLAEQFGFTLEFTPTGILSVPFLTPGQALTPEAFNLLAPAKQAEIRAKGQDLEHKVGEALLAIRRVEREAQAELRGLEREAVLFAVGHLLDALRAKYADQPRVRQHLDGVQTDLVEHREEFHAPGSPAELPVATAHTDHYERYRVNVLVSHDAAGFAPVVFEPNPTYYNLLGRVDYRATFGAMYTDFTLLKPGALHRANGGFLVLQARDLLLSPFAWDALKRALRDGEVRVENLGEQFSAVPTATLKPEPIPLQVKVVLIGDLLTYALLYRLDEDFQKLFKIKAQFGPTMDRSPDAILGYAAFVSQQVRAQGLLPFDKEAVARVLEHCARLAEHQERLSTRFSVVADLVLEADQWARRAGVDRVRVADVAQALTQQERRANLLEEEIQRLIDEGTIAIDTRAAVVGQVNGLSVLELGDYAFARPSRITASVGLGADGVINIEREVELSGRTHSKGVLILSGYLLGQYVKERPLAISARLAFEQVYDEVDGDSASSAELYALLSSLAEVPIKQGIAVTGSVNQRGEIQAVGAVTRKIEGYFAVCAARGLTGAEGVLIPAANVRHLMLKADVIEAVARGAFHVWAARTVDEGIALLTGVPAGERRPDGTYPPDTVHALVQQRLTTLATRLAEYGGRHQLGALPVRPAADGARHLGAATIDGRASGRARLRRRGRRAQAPSSANGAVR